MPVWLTGKVLVYAFTAIALLSLIGTGVYKVKQWGANEVRMEWEQASRDQREKELNQAMAAATGLEGDRAKTKTIYSTIEKRVVEYIDRPVYSSVCIDSDGLRNINDALDGKISDPAKPDATVPFLEPSDRLNR